MNALYGITASLVIWFGLTIVIWVSWDDAARYFESLSIEPKTAQVQLEASPFGIPIPVTPEQHLQHNDIIKSLQKLVVSTVIAFFATVIAILLALLCGWEEELEKNRA